MAVWEAIFDARLMCFQIGDKSKPNVQPSSAKIFKIVKVREQNLSFRACTYWKGSFISLYKLCRVYFHFWRFDLVSVLWQTVLKVAKFKILDWNIDNSAESV